MEKGGDSDLVSIKHCFDINIDELNLFFPLLYCMRCGTDESQDYAMFKGAVINFNQNMKINFTNNITLRRTISNAKLFLDDVTLERFYYYCKYEVKKIRETFDLILKNCFNEKMDVYKIERIFFENCTVGLYCLPTISTSPNIHFVEELINGITTYFIDTENNIDELSYRLIPKDTSQKRIKEKNTISTQNNTEDEFKKQDLHNYLQSWIDKTVTQNDWLHFKNVDVLESLEDYEISMEQLDEICQYKFKLFNDIAGNIFNNKFSDPFKDHVSNGRGEMIAKRDLALIDDFINGNVDEIKAERIKSVLGIKDWKKAIILAEDVIRNKYKSDNNHDIYHEDSHLQLTAVFKYKDLLESYLNKQEEIDFVSEGEATVLSNNKVLAFKYDNIKKDNQTLVHKELISLLALSSDVTLPQFKQLFNGKIVEIPIIWRKGDGDLMVFIRTAIQSKKLTCPYQQHWNIAVKCFVREDGSRFFSQPLKLCKPTKLASKFRYAANLF